MKKETKRQKAARIASEMRVGEYGAADMQRDRLVGRGA